MKQFNNAVLYVRNGQTIPAIVLKSQTTSDGELLTLLYANPDTGPGLIVQGTSRGVAAVANAVKPLTEGAMFGWENFPMGFGAALGNALAEQEIQKTVDEVIPPTVPSPNFPGAPPSDGDHVPRGDCPVPEFETKTYSDGTVVTGPGPHPDMSPAQQDAQDAEVVHEPGEQIQSDAPPVEENPTPTE